MSLASHADLLAVAPITRIRMDLTTRCNLRCVYCAVSQSAYRGADMPDDLARRVATEISELTNLQAVDAVHINGHGETTFLDGWVNICKPLLEESLPLAMTTNLAKTFSTEELETLARMNTIAISMDTCDAELLKRLRRKVDLRQIVMNVQLIRATSLRLGRVSPPEFEFSCGLYDQNTMPPLVEDFARFAVALGIERVGFWNLAMWGYEKFPYENTDVPDSDRVYPLDELTADDLRTRIEGIRRAIDVLNANGVVTQIAGNFIDILERQPNEGSQQAEGRGSLAIPEGMTRDCLDPWTYFEVNTNGDVQPCCARGSVGNLGQAELSEILDGGPIQKLRASLLSGDLDSECLRCPLRGTVEPEALEQKVRGLWTPAWRANHTASQEMAAVAKVTTLLTDALASLREGRTFKAWEQISQALAIDPMLKMAPGVDEGVIRSNIHKILAESRFPATLTWLAAICRHIGDRRTAVVLLQRYLDLAPDAADRLHVERDLRREKRRAVYEAIRNLPSGIALALKNGWLHARTTIQFRTHARSILRKLSS